MSPLHAYDQPYWGRRLAIVFFSIVALAAAGFIGSVLGPHFKSSSAAPTTTTTTHALATTTSTTVPHSSVTVLVANGTQEPNAAGHFAQILQGQGWNVQKPTNTTSGVTATTVYYAFAQQPAATLIAQALGVATSAVQPLSSSTPVGTTTGVNVVVVIGPDLAGNGFPATTVAQG